MSAGKQGIGVPLGALQGSVAALLVIKLAFCLVVPPNEDEAYYWLWGQHLELSYFDHAPLVGWMQGLSHLLFGWNLFALRAASFATFLGTALILRHWAKRLAPEDWQAYFWTSLAIYLASPLIFAITSLAYPDHWLMFFSLVSAHFFARFFADQIEGNRLRHLDLYLGAASLGLAALAKYNAVLMGIAVVVLILVHKRLRPLLRDPHLYLAALVSLGMLAPVIYWNIANDFISLRFQLWERHGQGAMSVAKPGELLRFVIVSALYLSPLLVVPLVNFLRKPAGGGFAGALSSLGKAMFVVSCGPMLYLATFVPTAPHWNILAFLVLFGFAAKLFWHRALLVAHLAFGAIAILILAGYYMSFAFINPGAPDGEAARLYGWDQLGRRMVELATEHDAENLGTYAYGAASKLAFAIGTTEVTSLAPNVDGFDYWRDDQSLAGENFIILDEYGVIDALRPQFAEIVPLETYTVATFGKPLMGYALYLGRGYRGAP